MNREQAIESLKTWKEESGIFRDRTLEIYNYFKNNIDADCYVFLDKNGENKTIKHDEFWDYISTYDIRKTYERKYVNQDFEDVLSTLDNTKLRKETLNYKQKLNYERNAFNKSLKELNTLEELNKELIENIKKIPKVNIKDTDRCFNMNSNIGVGAIVLSDLHFNELIDIVGNKYDFEVASKRLKKLAQSAIKTFKSQNISKVVILFLGDLLNSDRRQAEVFNMATNRSKAMVLAFHLLRQFIEEISSQFYSITIASVCGNESRVVGEEFDTSDILATYNYDYSIHQFLKVAFEKNDKVKFIDGDFGEKVININNSNVLILHGVNLGKDIEKSVQQTFGRYSSKGINLDYLFHGHLHSSRIGDTYARCGSLCGSNSYSEGALNLTSRASQLIGIFYPDKTNSIMRIDLQDVDNIEGYNIIDELVEYNIKSETKKRKFLIHNI